MKHFILMIALVLCGASAAIAQSQDSTWISDVSGDSVNLTALHPAVIVFANTRSCRPCVDTIGAILKAHHMHPLVLLLRSQASAIDRWHTLQGLELPHFPADTILFENTIEPDPWMKENLHGGYYGKYHIGITPAILLPTKDGHWKPLHYHDLYKNGDLQYKKLENALAGR